MKERLYQTSRLLLRCMDVADFGEVAALLSDSSISYLLRPSGTPLKFPDPSTVRFIARDPVDGSLVGMIAIKGNTISYCVAPTYSGAGFGHEIVNFFLQEITPSLQLSYLEAIILRENEASRKLVERLDFKFSGLISIQHGRNASAIAALKYRRNIQSN